MDEAYAHLSLKAGMIAGGADAHLGVTRFAEALRAHRWELTPAFLDTLRAEARALGVPEAILADPEEDERFKALLARVTAMQDRLTKTQH